MKGFLFLLPLAGVVIGCGGSANGLINQPNPRVRLLNAFAGVANANAIVGSDAVPDTTLVTPIPFGAVSDYAITTNTTANLSAGDAASSSQTNLATISNLFQVKGHYTGVGYGGAGARQILVLSDTSSAATSGTYALRLVDVSATGGGGVDLYVTAPGAALPAQPTTTALAASNASAYVAVTITGGGATAPFELRVYRQGDQSTVLYDSGAGTPVTLASTSRGTLIVFDDASKGSGVNGTLASDGP